MNFLEELAAEWYSYNGYFVRSNIKYGKLAHGGWTGEIDVAAYHPETEEFVHLEMSTDAFTWSKRRERFQRKFKDASVHYDSLFKFHRESTRKVAICGFAHPRVDPKFTADIEVVTIPDFVNRICAKLSKKSPVNAAVPENLPLLRAIQYAMAYGAAMPQPSANDEFGMDPS